MRGNDGRMAPAKAIRHLCNGLDSFVRCQHSDFEPKPLAPTVFLLALMTAIMLRTAPRADNGTNAQDEHNPTVAIVLLNANVFRARKCCKARNKAGK